MKKVLLIEDDGLVRDAYSTKLRLAGYEVDTAVDGVEGLEKVASFKPDLVLLDILLPRMDGIEFMEKLRPKGGNLKVLVFSNLSMPDLMKKAVKLGATGYLTKSTYTPNKVVEIIGKTLK